MEGIGVAAEMRAADGQNHGTLCSCAGNGWSAPLSRSLHASGSWASRMHLQANPR